MSPVVVAALLGRPGRCHNDVRASSCASTMKTSTKPKRLSRWPCIFRGRFIREQIDPRVKDLWERTTGKPAPFGRLRLAFQKGHCSAINPYGSDSCPYREEECALAFLSAVQNSLLPWVEDPAAYFVKVARSAGVERADNKPLARERHREEGSSHPGGLRPGRGPRRNGGVAQVGRADPSPRVVPEVLDEEDHLRRARTRPDAIGDLLGALNLGSRQGPANDGKESAQ